jgi:hypothetical protein
MTQAETIRLWMMQWFVRSLQEQKTFRSPKRFSGALDVHVASLADLISAVALTLETITDGVRTPQRLH